MTPQGRNRDNVSQSRGNVDTRRAQLHEVLNSFSCLLNPHNDNARSTKITPLVVMLSNIPNISCVDKLHSNLIICLGALSELWQHWKSDVKSENSAEPFACICDLLGGGR